jgi:hypothetical protein
LCSPQVSQISRLWGKPSAEDIFSKIKAALDEGDVRVPAGNTFSVDKIQTWIDAAKKLT